MASEFRPNQVPKADPEEEQYMTCQEIATYMRVRLDTIQRYAREGQLKAVRTGRSKRSHFRITVAEVRRFFSIPPERPIRVEVVKVTQRSAAGG